MQRFFLFDLKKDKKTFLKILILKGKQIVRHAESAQAMRFMTEAFDEGDARKEVRGVKRRTERLHNGIISVLRAASPSRPRTAG